MKGLFINRKKFGITLIVAILITCALSMNVLAAYVARIGTKKYKTMQGAVNAAKSGQTITVLEPITATNTVTVSGKKITINFVRKKYTFSPQTGYAFTLKSGQLTMKNLYMYSKAGSVKVASSAKLIINNGSMTGYTENRGTVLVKNGKFQGSGTELRYKQKRPRPAIRNYGTLMIETAAYVGTNRTLINNYGKAVIRGGTYTCSITKSSYKDDCYAIENSFDPKYNANVLIEGGTFTGTIINMADENGRMVILGGTFSAIPQKPAIENAGMNLILAGGKFIGKDSAAVVNPTETTLFGPLLTITGGTFISTGSCWGTITNSGELVITGGSFSTNGGKGSLICYQEEDDWECCQYYVRYNPTLEIHDHTDETEDPELM